MFVDKLPAIILPSSPLNDVSISPSTGMPNMISPILANVSASPTNIILPLISPTKPIRTPNDNSMWSFILSGFKMLGFSGITWLTASIAPFNKSFTTTCECLFCFVITSISLLKSNRNPLRLFALKIKANIIVKEFYLNPYQYFLNLQLVFQHSVKRALLHVYFLHVLLHSCSVQLDGFLRILWH